MEIQEMTGHIAESNNAMRAASTAMKLAQVELDRRQSLIDNYRDSVRDHERFVNAIYAKLKNDDLDGAYDLAKAEYLSIHGPND